MDSSTHSIRYGCACLVFSCILIVYFFYTEYFKPNPEQFVAFLDVGQGDAIFIETKEGFQILVDTGRGNKVLHALGSVMDIHDHSIDMIVITHPDKDHIGGLTSVLRRFDVLYLMVPDTEDVYAGEFIHSAIEKEELKILTPSIPSTIHLSEDVVMRILWGIEKEEIQEDNARSLVLHIQGKKESYLLTGDIPASIERELVKTYGDSLRAGVLKLSHHGSKSSSEPSFLKAVAPHTVIVSAGLENRYGHPHNEVLERIESVLENTRILHTGKDEEMVFDL